MFPGALVAQELHAVQPLPAEALLPLPAGNEGHRGVRGVLNGPARIFLQMAVGQNRRGTFYWVLKATYCFLLVLGIGAFQKAYPRVHWGIEGS